MRLRKLRKSINNAPEVNRLWAKREGRRRNEGGKQEVFLVSPKILSRFSPTLSDFNVQTNIIYYISVCSRSRFRQSSIMLLSNVKVKREVKVDISNRKRVINVEREDTSRGLVKRKREVVERRSEELATIDVVRRVETLSY